MDSKPTHARPRPKRPTRAHLLGPVILTAIFLATLFTAWTPSSLSIGNLNEQFASLLTPQAVAPDAAAATPLPPPRIGLVAGHLGNDSGAVCYDANGEPELTEQEMNEEIALLVKASLEAKGFQVDMLQEYDTRLGGYRAAALVSIHNDSCDYINDEATGFKVAAARDTRDINRADRLTACLIDRYGRATGMKFHAGSITGDMTDYHTFSEIDPNTVAAIIETGFLNLDRAFLLDHTDLVVDGIVQGILCFVHNESVEPTPIP